MGVLPFLGRALQALAPLPLGAARTETGGLRWADLPPSWVLTLVAIGLLFALRALYRRERGGAGTPVRLLLAGVRTLVLLLILLALAGPYREEVRIAEERAHLVVLVDASGSTETVDRYPDDVAERLREAAWPGGAGAPPADAPLEATRLDLLKRVLAPEGDAVLRSLDRRFVLHAFAFASDWWSLGSTREEGPAEALPAGGEDPVATIGQAIRTLDPGAREQGGTNLGAVLRGVAGEYLGREDRRLAGVLLLTDGRDTETDEKPLEVLAGLGSQRKDLHVTPVALGNAASGRNVSVERIRALDVVLVGDDVVFETAIDLKGVDHLADVRARLTFLQVADAEGRPVDPPQPYVPPGDVPAELGPWRLEERTPTPVRVPARMGEAGTYRVSVRAVLPPDAAREDAIRTDDEAVHEIRVVDQRIRVLLVDNLPRREFHFLGNWLTREPGLDVARVDVRRRYEAQLLQQSADRTVEQRASAGLEPLRAFPRSRRELFEYDVVILGDVDWTRLAESSSEALDLLALLRDFVREGGGLALVGGIDYRNPLGFRDTPLEDLLPITPRDRDANASDDTETEFGLALTDVGRLHPIFGVVPAREGNVADPDEVAQAWAGARPFSREWRWWWLYRATGGLKPGATALAEARAEGPDRGEMLDENGRPLVVFATMPYGRGRTFFSAIDQIWRLRYGYSDRYYGPFWDQVIRYLATYRLLGGNKRYKISTDKDTYLVGETAAVTITALDRDFEPVRDAYLEGVHVEDPRGQDTVLADEARPANATPDGAAPGTYRLLLPLRREGTWRIWIADATPGTAGAAESRAERRIEAEYQVPEKRLVLPDHDVLLEIARQTDGRLVDGRPATLPDLPALAADLPAAVARRVLSREERTQWDKAWVLLLLVGLLALEWVLRKRAQMI